MKITSISVFHADAGWRPWTFVKISTNEGIIGWSECSDSHGSPRGIEGVIKDLSNIRDNFLIDLLELKKKYKL